MKQNLVRTLALVAAVGVAACGDDDVTSTGDELSETEVAALSGIIVEQAFGATASAFGGLAPAAVDGPQRAPFSYSTDISTTVSCDAGGTVGLDGSATVSGDDETFEFQAVYSLNTTFSGCQSFADEVEQNFTLDGALNYSATLDYDGDPNSQDIGGIGADATMAGSIAWSSDDGRSGTCGVDLRSTTTTTSDSVSASTTGSFCGTSINETFTYNIPG